MQLGIAPPAPHAVGVQLTCAELAWARRDARELGVTNLEHEMPSAPHEMPSAPIEMPSAPIEASDAPAASPSSAAAASSASSSAAAATAAPPPRFELQRALTHVQLSRAWTALGRTEAQLETGTSIVHLEQLQVPSPLQLPSRRHPCSRATPALA